MAIIIWIILLEQFLQEVSGSYWNLYTDIGSWNSFLALKKVGDI